MTVHECDSCMGIDRSCPSTVHLMLVVSLSILWLWEVYYSMNLEQSREDAL